MASQRVKLHLIERLEKNWNQEVFPHSPCGKTLYSHSEIGNFRTVTCKMCLKSMMIKSEKRLKELRKEELRIELE